MTTSSTQPANIARARVPFVAAVACCLLWIVLSAASLASSQAAGNVMPQGDAERGKQLFEKRCTGCHSLTVDKEGPRLGNVYGRKAASIPCFSYSDAMKSAQITWNDALLDKWLTDTESVVPDNNMDFRVPNPEERADVIQFLKVSSGR